MSSSLFDDWYSLIGNRSTGFELVRWDFLVDENLKLYLLEVSNTKTTRFIKELLVRHVWLPAACIALVYHDYSYSWKSPDLHYSNRVLPFYVIMTNTDSGQKNTTLT